MASVDPPHRVRAPMVVQSWSLVTFLHWPVPTAALAPLIPEPLHVDTFDGVAWVSLVLFSTTCEVAGVVPAPGPRRFPETNVRTYVRGPDGEDGLYFFSLDVTNRANAVLGRALHLPYHLSDMTIADDTMLRYGGHRRARDHVGYDVAVLRGTPKTPSPLDVFLTGRWSAYVAYRHAVVRYNAEHPRWPLHDARLVSCDENLFADIRLAVTGAPSVTHFAPAVSARITPAHFQRHS